MSTQTSVTPPAKQVQHLPHNSKILLFGEVLLDQFPDRSVLGGAPFNVSCHLQAFGLSPTLITRVGTDPLRDQILYAMQVRGLDTQGVQFDPSHPTGRVAISEDEGGHHFDILPDQAYDYIHSGVAHLVELATQPQLVYFGTLAQRSLTSRRALNHILSGHEAKRFLDLNLRPPWIDLNTIRHSLRQADIVKLNDDELAVLQSKFALPLDPQQQIAELIHRFQLDIVVVTRGPEGAWYMDKDGHFQATVHSGKQNVIDTVGAGDGFAAVLLAGLQANWPADLLLQRAHNFAAAVCSLRGAIPETSDFYQPFLEAWQ